MRVLLTSIKIRAICWNLTYLLTYPALQPLCGLGLPQECPKLKTSVLINTLTAGLTSQFLSEHVAHGKRAMRATVSRAIVLTLLFHGDKRRCICRSRSLFSTSFILKRITERQAAGPWGFSTLIFSSTHECFWENLVLSVRRIGTKSVLRIFEKVDDAAIS